MENDSLNGKFEKQWENAQRFQIKAAVIKFYFLY